MLLSIANHVPINTDFNIDKDYPLEQTKEIINEKLQLIQKQTEYIKALTLETIFYARLILYIGIILFLIGYLPFLYQQLKSKTKK